MLPVAFRCLNRGRLDRAAACRPLYSVHALALATAALATAPNNAMAGLPEIRMHANNGVPACVTTDRLMAFLQKRNQRLAGRYRDIAKWYRHHGEAWRVRWDYAFFQMALETNFLTYRRGDGSPGDVQPQQNNFAGIGATGGGVPGDRFPDVGTGVLAQIQHLVAYSGERVAQPVATRTALKQNDIVYSVRRLRRPVRFSDLARRWAADPRYASSISAIAENFHRMFCNALQRQSEALQIGASKAVPPVPNSAAKARARLVARRIWQRGDRDTASETVATTPPMPQAAQRIAMEPGQKAARANHMLAGLQDIARSMRSAVSLWPSGPETTPEIIAPVPRLAQRTPRLAARD